MKVLLFSNDLMPFGNLPTSGGGLRCWQMMKGLESHGIEVLASMPAFTYLTETHYNKIPQEQRDLLWHWETQDDILARTKPDAVMFASNWDHYGLSKDPDIPLIIDLHGSRYIETSMWNEPVDTGRKTLVLSKADCLLCAGMRQRSYFSGWLVQGGRVPENEHFLRYIPVSLSPDQPEHIYPSDGQTSSPLFVSGGGWFPWQNQSKAIFAAANSVISRDHGSIEIFGTPHETQNLSSQERVIRDIYQELKTLSDTNDRVSVNGYIGRDDLLEIYKHAGVALEVMEYNLERELAFTTRTIEYLWCGLPVLYNDFGEIAEHIRDYDAGWTVDPADPVAIQAAIDEIMDNPQLVETKGRNAKALVKDRFSWDKTIIPLVEFLNAPRKMPKLEPVMGTMCARASYLSPKGTVVAIEVSQTSGVISQPFIVPAENIKSIELPVSLNSLEDRSAINKLVVRIERPDGKKVVTREFSGEQLPLNGKVSMDFPLLRRPVGGSEFVLRIECISSNTASVNLQGILEGGYPYIAIDSEGIKGKTLLGQEVYAKALTLHFIPGESRLYRIKALIGRSIWMVRKGEFSRLWRAVFRRIPGYVYRLRHVVSR